MCKRLAVRLAGLGLILSPMHVYAAIEEPAENQRANACYAKAQLGIAAAMAKDKTEPEAIQFIKSYTVITNPKDTIEISNAEALTSLRDAQEVNTDNLSKYARSVFVKCLNFSEAKTTEEVQRLVIASQCFVRSQVHSTYAWFRTVKGSKTEYSSYYTEQTGKELPKAIEDELEKWYLEPIGRRNLISSTLYEMCILRESLAKTQR